MVSHDVEFLRGAADVILEVRDHHVTRYQGGYDYYKEKLLEQEQKNSPSALRQTSDLNLSSDSQKEKRKERAARRQELSKEKKHLENRGSEMEKRIEQAENEKAEIIASLSDPSGKCDFAALQKRLNELETTIDDATMQWENAASALETLMTEYNAIANCR